MKWVKFESDFDKTSGSLRRYLRGTDNLILYKKIHTHALEPDILVSKANDHIIDSCYRIYTGDSDKFEDEYLHKEGTSNKHTAYFHKWLYISGLPNEYFDPTYFDIKYLDEYEKDYHAVKTNPNREWEYTKAKSYISQSYPRPHPYEIYIGGWIQFFDEQVRCGDTDHAVYFDWEITNRAVTIYILQTKPLHGWNVNVNINITNPPTSTDPPPPKPGPPGC
jgi:hypothetical protein